MKISLIVAAATDNAIGKNNQLLWHLPNDLKFFKNMTWGMPVVMGRKTFEALSGQPLPGRLNIIVTRQQGWQQDKVVVVNNVKDALFLAQENKYAEVLISGGGEIYKETINEADKIYLTRVHATFEGADAFFPEVDKQKWHLTSHQDFLADDKHAYDYSFQVWERK
ncbi:dihydrofolate reductase [Filimonas lacunae]|uniref:Dihydrofolate reductase n=1 Tax=Filimonas lacunae TaxID=477680 RepID=A0A173MLD8_9BACT|nr:dihydrofolate reductase [Filimonas lacunae]BAV08424.1 dihydrofolate reductase [Filimonas lacunae]SIT33904.1 dihydrofolate reductase [Filimonas lacunae]